jgi:hypothetical protein
MGMDQYFPGYAGFVFIKGLSTMYVRLVMEEIVSVENAVISGMMR